MGILGLECHTWIWITAAHWTTLGYTEIVTHLSNRVVVRIKLVREYFICCCELFRGKVWDKNPYVSSTCKSIE